MSRLRRNRSGIHVANLGEKGRIRLALIAQVAGEDRGWGQWISTESNQISEQLDIRQLRALGYEVAVESYGLRLSAGTHVTVAKAWPYTAPVREKDARLYNLSGDGAGTATASAARGRGAGVGAHGTNGGTLVSVGTRPAGTFPESVQNRYGGR